MAHSHHDHAHDHDHDHDHDHGHRSLRVDEAPLDAANQSLADALKATFSILKFIMLLLLVAFGLSGFSRVDENEQAIVLRFGKPLPGVRQPGLSAAWPFPIDETIHLPVKQLKTLQLSTHWPSNEHGGEGGGLDPIKDGALLTGDRGLVHVKWNMTYQLEDIESFVNTLADSDLNQEQRIEQLLSGLLRTAAVDEASAMTALDIYPRSPETLASKVRVRLNASLDELKAGIRVASLDIPDSSVPAPAKDAFLDVTRQQSTRQKLIRQAEQRAVAKLNGAAGQSHIELLTAIDKLDAARSTGNKEASVQAEAEVDRLFESEVSGEAGELIAQAKAFYAESVHAMQADVREYENLLGEYRRSPALLVMRLWTEARESGLNTPGLNKWFLPGNVREIRLPIGPDPMLKKQDERERLLKEQQDADEIKDTGPEARIGRRGQT